MRTAPDWLYDAIVDGLSALLTLSLDRTPAADVIPATAEVWARAVADLDWDRRRDTPRIAEAFDTLFRTRESWPSPKHFRDAIPVYRPLAIVKEFTPASDEVRERVRAEVYEAIGRRDVKSAAAGDDT